jgi:hypothetical protein
LIAVVLLGSLAASIHRRPLVSAPRSLAPITKVIEHDSAALISSARRDVTDALQRR